MVTSMTPSKVGPITDGQIDKAVSHYRDMLTTHRSKVGDSNSVQKVLGSDEYLGEQVGVLRRHVAMASKLIVRHFKVDRTKTPAQLLESCGRVPWYINAEVLATMPMNGPEEGDLEFFPFELNTPIVEIQRVLSQRGLVPDYAAQMQVNADDPAFADKHPNVMQWGKNYAHFIRHNGKRGVRVDCYVAYSYHSIWVAGRRKK